jgi:hypothetical protein
MQEVRKAGIRCHESQSPSPAAEATRVGRENFRIDLFAVSDYGPRPLARECAGEQSSLSPVKFPLGQAAPQPDGAPPARSPFLGKEPQNESYLRHPAGSGPDYVGQRLLLRLVQLL